MTAGEFEKKYPDVWKSFSDYTKRWFEDKMDERLDVAHGMAKHQLDAEHKKRMPRLQAARDKRVRRLNDLTSLNNDYKTIMDTLGIKLYKYGNVWWV